MVIFHWGREHKVNIFQFVIGDFCFSDTKEVNKHIYNRHEYSIYNTYRNITLGTILTLVLALKAIPADSLIIGGASLISLGVALSAVTFNYSRVEGENEEGNNFVYSSAKRFFLAAILGIFSLALLACYKYLPSMPTSIPEYSLYSFTTAYFIEVLGYINSILIVFLLILAIRYLCEGFLLSLKELITLDKSNRYEKRLNMASNNKTEISKLEDKYELGKLIKKYREELINEMEGVSSGISVSEDYLLIELLWSTYNSQKELTKLTKELKDSSRKLNILTIILAILTTFLVIDVILNAFN